jgi:exopolysaccharide biosynthesis polyprenyl glycosylphosphotransferase
VASIIPINIRRASRASSVAHAKTENVAADDLFEVIDDRTRHLLARPARSRRGWMVPRALVIADLVALSVSYLLATVLWGGHGVLGSKRELILFVASLPCWVLVAELHGLYHRDEQRANHSTADDIVGVFHLVTIGAWLLFVTSRLAGWDGPNVFSLTGFWLLAVCLVPLARTIARDVCRRSPTYAQNTVIVGAGDIGQLIARKLLKHPEYGANVVGFVDRTPKARHPDLPDHLAILGGPDRLHEIIKCLDVERVVIAFSSEPVPELLSLLRELRAHRVQIDLVPWLFELIGTRVCVHDVEGLTLLGLPPARGSSGSRALKRMLDVVGAGIGLALLSPLMAYIALRIRRDSPGPILFRQIRLGTNMKEFTALKFRTMKVNTDPEAHREYIQRAMSITAQAEGNGLYKLERSDAVTGFGRRLRKTSLDELPQLINVLRGDMSLVGPRPCIPYEAENFKPHHLERFLVPQGLTGLWQVTARANSTYLEALDLDVAYARDWTLGLDLMLLLRTPLEVLRQRRSTA